ncbi:hypothetical protein QS257_01380 [Terrilactibacillus sp. S3-3]|nr:hypothetical protein QS257_01380 [Terrilactibacillus sp. S3-3]
MATFRYLGMMAGITVGGSLFDLLLSWFMHKGSGAASSFLGAFSLVMWIGALFGVAGIACTLSMTKVNRQ